eukprot:gene17613-biopygen2961
MWCWDGSDGRLAQTEAMEKLPSQNGGLEETGTGPGYYRLRYVGGGGRGRRHRIGVAARIELSRCRPVGTKAVLGVDKAVPGSVPKVGAKTARAADAPAEKAPKQKKQEEDDDDESSQAERLHGKVQTLKYSNVSGKEAEAVPL